MPPASPKAMSVRPDLLQPNPWNSNHVSPDNESKLEASIRRRGLFKPIIVREKGGFLQILGGEHRWQVAKKIGLSEIPVFNLGPIDDKSAQEIGLLDNARYGADDALSLQNILASLGTATELASFMPYTDVELKEILHVDTIALDELDADPEEIDDPGEAAIDLPKAPKTHTIMRFKVPIEDAERIAGVISDTQKRQGYTTEDAMTNAGDALVHLLVRGGQSTLIDTP